MSCSKLLPTGYYHLLCFWNRDQLERFSVVSRSLKNLIERYFHTKPYRVFDRLWIHGGLYALYHNNVQWHPNPDDYSVQQFLAGQESQQPWNASEYYSFAEMRPYLGPTVRMKAAVVHVAGDSIYSPDHIEEMESIAYLWRDHNLEIFKDGLSQIVAEDIQPMLNSTIILHCRLLNLYNAHFSFKDYNVLYTVKVIRVLYFGDGDIDLNYWPNFLEQPGVKPVVALCDFRRDNIDNTLDRLKHVFSSAVVPNAFKIVFAQYDESLTKFRETNNTSGEKLELKDGIPVEYQEYLADFDHYTLERSSI